MTDQEPFKLETSESEKINEMSEENSDISNNISPEIELSSDTDILPETQKQIDMINILNSDMMRNLKLLDAAFISENWLYYFVTILQCY